MLENLRRFGFALREEILKFYLAPVSMFTRNTVFMSLKVFFHQNGDTKLLSSFCNPSPAKINSAPLKLSSVFCIRLCLEILLRSHKRA